MAKKKTITVCLWIKPVFVPIEVTRESLIDAFIIKKEQCKYSVYPDTDDRYRSENAEIFFQSVPTAVEEFTNRYIVRSIGIISPIAIFGYDDPEDAVDHFLEIVKQLRVITFITKQRKET